jgi:hypothetical protein
VGSGGYDRSTGKTGFISLVKAAHQLNAVKTVRLPGIFLVQFGNNRIFTEQSRGSLTTQMSEAGFFLERIIASVLTRKNSAIANIPPIAAKT